MRSYKDIIKIHNIMTEQAVKCKCGHSVNMFKKNKIICSWCGNYVYKNKNEEFKDKLNKSINKR